MIKHIPKGVQHFNLDPYLHVTDKYICSSGNFHDEQTLLTEFQGKRI